MSKLERDIIFNNDVDAAGVIPCPSLTSGLIVTGLGILTVYIGGKFMVAQRLANGNQQPEKELGPEERSRLMASVLISKIEAIRESASKIDPDRKNCDNKIKDWAHRNRFNEFSINKHSMEVYELIMNISGHLILMVQMEGNIPDYISPGKDKYFSSLNLVADLMAWFILEASLSEESPFLTCDDEMTESDIQYMERTKKELKGFLDAILHDWKTDKINNGDCSVFAYLKANDFVSVTPLLKLKKAASSYEGCNFIHDATKDEQHHLGDINFTIIENFRKRMKENLKEPCLLARRYEKKKEQLKTVQEIREFLQLVKDAGTMVMN